MIFVVSVDCTRAMPVKTSFVRRIGVTATVIPCNSRLVLLRFVQICSISEQTQAGSPPSSEKARHWLGPVHGR